MRAIRVEKFGDPDVLTIREVPDPTPGPGDVLVRIRAAGVNPVETYIRSGQYASLPALPYTPGSDGAGEVRAVGAGVQGIAVGDRVWVQGGGTYAELAVVPQDRVHPLPDGVPFEYGAALGVPYITAYRALFIAGHARPGNYVLVHGGSGGVGLAALQFARLGGLVAVGTASTEEGRALIREQGAAALDHDAYEEARLVTKGHGFDVIVEMAAHASLGKVLPLVAIGGRVAVVGSRGPVEITPRDLMGREASLIGVMAGYTTAEETSQIAGLLYDGMASGALRPHVGRKIALKDAPLAHRAVMEPGAQGKIVLIPDE
ncbi:MAG: NADPH:quinone reductase [Clostridia bacterium]